MAKRLIINDIESCSDLKISMDNVTVSGNFDEVAINRLRNVKQADISMCDMTVISSQGASYSRASDAGPLNLNQIDESNDTSINQDGLQVYGKFGDTRVNDVKGSSGTAVSMRGAVINSGNSSSESDDGNSGNDNNSNHKPRSDDDCSDDGMVTLHIDMPGTGSSVCIFEKSNQVKDIVECISGSSKPWQENIKIVFEDIKSKKILGKDYSMRLDEAGFRHDMKLRTVEITEN